jgi:hypothetical protein
VIRVDAPGYVQWVHKMVPASGSTHDVVIDVSAERSNTTTTPTPTKVKTTSTLVRDPGF